MIEVTQRYVPNNEGIGDIGTLANTLAQVLSTGSVVPIEATFFAAASSCSYSGQSQQIAKKIPVEEMISRGFFSLLSHLEGFVEDLAAAAIA